MPIYEYTCRECKSEFETLLFGSEQPECPQCHGHELDRRMSIPARPRGEAGDAPGAACQSSGPPCGPVCRRWPGK